MFHYSCQPRPAFCPQGISFCGNANGIDEIYEACKRLYPDQENPSQIATVVKYWLGGPDPLDFIRMYDNGGYTTNANDSSNPASSPPHWHYVTLGLSDIHGDGRVHAIQKHGRSGFGYELTFRLKKLDGETEPPKWPATLLQALAKYVFEISNPLCSGDHISWHAPLDCITPLVDNTYKSHVTQMLIANDPQLPPINTALGSVEFLQIVGVLTDEMQAAQKWNGHSVIDMLRASTECGGQLLVTDMQRSQTVLSLSANVQQMSAEGGCNLSGVTSECWWSPTVPEGHTSHRQPSPGGAAPHLTAAQECQIKEALRRGLQWQYSGVGGGGGECKRNSKCEQLLSTPTGTDEFVRCQAGASNAPPTATAGAAADGPAAAAAPGPSAADVNRPRAIQAVTLYMSVEAAKLLPLVISGRLKQGRHFTYKNMSTPLAVTFVTGAVHGTLVDDTYPYAAANAFWLQIFISDDFLEQFLSDVTKHCSELDGLMLPTGEATVWSWPERGLYINVLTNIPTL